MSQDVGEQTADSSVKSDRGVQLRLDDIHIWHSFAACGAKMLVSPDGRCV
jgi:hypothetical protein